MNNFINSIISFFSNGYHTIKKDDVAKTLESVMANYETNVLPSIDTLLSAVTLASIKNSTLITALATACDISPKDSKSVLTKLKTTFENILRYKRQLLTLVEKELASVSTDRSIRAKDAAIVRLVSDLGSMGVYILDLLNLISIGTNNTNIPKIRIEDIKNNISTFGELYKTYGDWKRFESLLEEISTMTTVSLDVSKNESDVLAFALGAEKTPMLPSTHGFIGNPLYHIGMWLVDKDISNMEDLKRKRDLIALRVLELQQQQDKAPTDELQKQIGIYEDEITELEYKISKLRNK